MSDGSKAFEKNLDKDFLFYLNLIKNLYENVNTDVERHQCEVWLTHLVGKSISCIAEKCDRNIFLSRLLLQMQNGQLKGIFLDTPPQSGNLPCAFTTFGLPTEVEGLKGFEEMGFQVDSSFGGNLGGFFEASRDGRTYMATRHLPEGMMAFIAVTNNDGEELWTPQFSRVEPVPRPESKVVKKEGKFVKKLGQFVQVPISQLRKSQKDRESVTEWMDKMIDDCNKWLQGQDPHNMDLETLFELMYKDYQLDSDKAEILKHPKKVRNILIKDIRERITERRAEITKRELILDQLEADEYVEEKLPGEGLDDVWLQCAKKPLNETVKMNLESFYPEEVIQRFSELLYQERLNIIEKGEKEANKKIAELRSGSLEDIKKELQRLKKVQQDYKEFYGIYKDLEQRQLNIEKEMKEKSAKLSDKSDNHQNIENIKREIETEIEQAKERFDKERKTQNGFKEQLEDAKETFQRLREKINFEEEKLCHEKNQLKTRREDIEQQIRVQKKKRDELLCKLSRRM